MDLDSILNQATLAQMGGGTLAGIAVGYAAKRTLRLALVVLGVVLVGLYILSQQGFITVHWDQVSKGIEDGSRGAGAYVATMIRQLSPSLLGFGAGFALGFKL